MAQKSSIFKTLVGCGCALVLVGLVGLAVLVWGAYEASKAVKAYAEQNIDVGELKRLKEEFGIPDVARKEVERALERPFEEGDVDAFLALNDWYYTHPAAEKANRLVTLDPSNPSEFLATLGDADAQKQVSELLKAFPAEVNKQGGWARATDAAVRTSALAVVARGVGLASSQAPGSKAVADAMVANADKFKDRAWLDEKGAGAVADVLQVIPKQSLVNWAALPQVKRDRAIAALDRQAKAALAAKFNPVLNTCRTLGACP